MSKEWFIHSNDVVTGPFSTTQVREGLEEQRWVKGSFIWWKGQREWLSIEVWLTQLPKILKSERERTQSPVWYVDVAGAPIGPLTQNEMLENLRGISQLARVRLWTVGLNKWTNLFELHEVMDELGISRRENQRAPVLGTVAIMRTEDSESAIARAASISVAGMGVNDACFLGKGEAVQMIIKSGEFTGPIRVTGTVAYVTAQGYAGIRFDTLPAEAQTIIIEYVNKFNVPQQKSA